MAIESDDDDFDDAGGNVSEVDEDGMCMLSLWRICGLSC